MAQGNYPVPINLPLGVPGYRFNFLEVPPTPSLCPASSPKCASNSTNTCRATISPSHLISRTPIRCRPAYRPVCARAAIPRGVPSIRRLLSIRWRCPTTIHGLIPICRARAVDGRRHAAHLLIASRGGDFVPHVRQRLQLLDHAAQLQLQCVDAGVQDLVRRHDACAFQIDEELCRLGVVVECLALLHRVLPRGILAFGPLLFGIRALMPERHVAELVVRVILEPDGRRRRPFGVLLRDAFLGDAPNAKFLAAAQLAYQAAVAS